MGSKSRKREREISPDDVVDDNTKPKRRREFTERQRKFAKLYDDLADERSDVRIQAAKDLISDFTPEKEPSGEAVEQCLARLIRGLCSGRKAARFGFFIALTELLRQFYPSEDTMPGVPDLSKLVVKINELTDMDGSVVGQERKDHLFGRVSAYKALLQSSALLSSENVKIKYWPEVLDHIFKLATDVPWLREECGMMLCDFVRSLKIRITDVDGYVQPLLSKLESHKLSKTPEGVAIWLTIQSEFPELELPKGIWKKKDPLCTKERPVLMAALAESVAQEHSGDKKAAKGKTVNGKGPKNKESKVKTGTWQPKPNFAWDLVLQRAVQKMHKCEKFQQFWIEIVDNGLFSPKASAERKLWGFAVFSKTLIMAPDRVLPTLFSRNLMRCLINQRVDDERALHAASTEPLKKMRARVQQEPDLAPIFVTGLLTGNGTIPFDRMTKTKTVEDILALASNESLIRIFDLFERLIRRPPADDSRSVHSHRSVLADMIVSTVKDHVKDQNTVQKLSPNEPWLEKALTILALLAYSVPSDAASADAVPDPPISEEARSVFQSRLSSCFTHIFSNVKNASSWPVSVVTKISTISNSSNSYQLAVQVDDLVAESITRAHKTLDKIQEEEKGNGAAKASAMNAFKLMYAFALLQVYGGDADAVSMLDELRDSYNSLTSDSGDRSQPFALMVELLLSFLSRPGALYKKLAEQAFPAFAADLDEATLYSLLDILAKSESLAGQQELFDHEEDAEGDAEDDEEEDSNTNDSELDSDVEMVEEADHETNDECSDEEDNLEDEEELRKFNALLAETLKTPLNVGDAANGTAEDTSDGEDMDDDQMMALEPHLTKIFQQRQSLSNNAKKKVKQNAKENMINFKNRVLDLLIIYIMLEYKNPLTLKLLLPLLQLTRTTTSPPVAHKANEVMHRYFSNCTKNKTVPKVSTDETEVVWQILRDTHDEVKKEGFNFTKDTSKLHGGACSRASLFLVKVLVMLDKDNYGKALDIYAETQKEWFQRKTKINVQPRFFTEWISWSTEARKQKFEKRSG